MKGHKIAISDSVFANTFDSEVETCVMQPLDLLFETL